jgi:hypothetical protein
MTKKLPTINVTTEQYREFVSESLKTEGWKTVDIMNKMALEIGAITLDQYRMAAKLILNAYYEAHAE